MKKYRLLSLLLLLSLLMTLLPIPAAAADEPELYCTHAILMDGNYNEILYDKDAYGKAYPASLTKVTTALLVMEALDSGKLTLSQKVTAGPTALDDLTGNYSTANIKIGDSLTVEQLLYCLLLPSANEAANILAVAVDGSIDGFVEHMNQRAKELGCKGTHYVNPHGLHDPDHYTTAYDIALVMQAALNHDLFRTIIKTAVYNLPAKSESADGTGTEKAQTFYNTNGLISNLHYRGYVYDKCIGGKTGNTDEAGRCLVAAAESGETLLISVVLGSGPVTLPGEREAKQGQLISSRRLLQWGFDNFKRVTITQGDEPVDEVAVTLSRQADKVLVKPQGSVTRTLPKDLDVSQIETTVTLFSPTVEAPVEAGQVLGSMELSYDGTVYGTIDLVAVTSVERSELLYKKAQFLGFFQHFGVRLVLGLILLAIAVVVLRITVFRKSRRYGAGFGGKRRTGSYHGGRRRR